MQQRLLLFSLIINLLLTGCRHSPTSHGEAPRLDIEVGEVVADSIVMRYEFVTHLESSYDAVIQPRVSGYLLRSNVKAGKPVRRGELLFELDANLLSTSLLAAQADLLSAQARESEARSNYERAQPLALQGAISRSQMDDYKTTYESARQAVRAARQQLKNAQLQVGYARILSPIDGIAANPTAHVGDYVGVGTQFPTLTTISNMDTLQAEVAIPTSLYLRYASSGRAIYENQGLLSDVTLYLDNGEEYKYKGIYDYTRQNISPTAGTITLVVDFPNPDAYLKVGEYARIETGMGTKQRCLLVPQRAVESSQGVSFVWIIDDDDVAHYRRVEVAEAFGEQFIILSGVQAGERVALTGGQKLREGMKVTPIIK